MDEIFAVILKDTYSLSQLKHRLRILKSNLLRTFFGSQDPTVSTPGVEKSDYTPGVNLAPEDLNWLKSLPLQFYQKFTRDNVYKIFADLDDTAHNLKIMTLYLSFEPDNNALAQIGSFARKTYNLPALLLDVKLDPGLIAGTALSWKGVYKDYSLRSQLALKKRELSKEFKKFLR